MRVLRSPFLATAVYPAYQRHRQRMLVTLFTLVYNVVTDTTLTSVDLFTNVDHFFA